jgi:hypothetical protein
MAYDHLQQISAMIAIDVFPSVNVLRHECGVENRQIT